MSKENQIVHHEVYTHRGEKLTGTYAGKRVREYDSYDPRLVIDIFKDGNYFGKIIADNFTFFETGVCTRLDRVELVRGHHKARLIFGMGNSIPEEGVLKHEVFSPEGIVGYAYGDNLDFYLASLFHSDPKIKEKAEEGAGRFDDNAQRYIEQALGIEGLFRK